MHLFSFQNRVPANVVNKIGQTDIEFSTSDPDRTKRDSVHGTVHKSEYVLDPATGFGFLSVAFLLLIGQRLATIPFFADTVFHMVGDFLSDMGQFLVAALPFLCEYCLPYVKPGGSFVALKGPSAAEELTLAKKAIDLLGGADAGISSRKLPSGDERCFVTVKKKSQTPTKYPRNSGQIKKKSL